MQGVGKNEGVSQTAARIVALAIAYYFAGKAGLLLAIPPGYATVFWPASGIALTAVYMYGYPALLGVFIGSAVLNVMNGPVLTMTSALTGSMIAAGSTLQVFVAVWLLRRYVGLASRLERLRKILAFVLLSGPVSCLIAATCGAATLLLNGLIAPEKFLFIWGTWYIGDVLGIVAFSPLLVLMLDKQATRSRKLVVGIPLMVLFIGVMTLFVEMKARHTAQDHQEFMNDSNIIMRDIQYAFSSTLREIQSLAAFYNASENVEKDEFEKFVSQSLLHMPGILALEWMPRVTEAERASFIKQLRINEGNPHLYITEINDENSIQPATRRAEYFPIYYVEPKESMRRFVGLDLSANKARREALERARDEGVPVGTKRIRLLQDKGQSVYSMIVFLPIYNNDMPSSTVQERRRALKGFVAGAFRFKDIIDPFISSWRMEGIKTSVISREEMGSEIVYDSEENYSLQREGLYNEHKDVISIFGRKLEVSVGKLDSYALKHINWSIWATLGGGILFIGFFGVFLLYITGHTAEVEQIVEERTEALRQARDRADAASRTKSQFLANMSHEIRTPMTGIIGMAQLLDKTEMSGPQRRYTEAIFSSAENLLQIIDDILDISKIEAGKVSVESIPFSLRRVCQDVFGLLEPQARRKGISLGLSYKEDCPEFFIGDPLRIRQILFNLCSNAIKFTEEGGVRINIHADDVTDEAASVRVAVADTGIGIAAENRDKVFGQFDQADSTTTRKYGGTGLGLSISRNLAQMMGSDIELDSVVGHGSVFSFILDLPRADEKDVGGAFDVGSETFTFKDCNVLLVEDTPINQEIIATMLGSRGLVVDTAENGSVALDKVRRHAYDVIFMDCQMPVMDGYEATRALRTMPEGINIPVIALTAHALQGDRERCLEAGMNDYIPKPVRDAVLMSALAKWLPAEKRISGTKEAGAAKPRGGKYKHLNGLMVEELRSVTGERFQAMLEMYIQSASQLLDDAEKSLARNDRETFARTVHSLKSSSGQVGAEYLRHLLADMEKDASDGAVKGLARKLAAARLEFRDVKAELREIN